MAETTTVGTLNAALKVYASGPQTKVFNTAHFLNDRLKRGAGDIKLGGRTFEMSLKHRGGGSWRTLAEMEPLPHPGGPSYKLATVDTKTAASVVRFSLMAMQTGKGTERAWIDAKKDLFDDCVEQFAIRFSQMYYRDGTGAVARVNGAPIINPGGNGGSFVVDAAMSAGSNDTRGLMDLQVEMRISASANLTGLDAERTFDGRITDIDEATLRVTFDGNGGDLTDGDYIFIGSKSRTSKNRDYMGLLGIIDDGTKTATLQGINRLAAGNQFWRANRLGTLGAADLENVWQTQSDTINRTSNGGKITDLITTYGVRRRFANDLKTDRRFVTTSEAGKYKGGFTTLEWMDGNNRTISIWVDKDCPVGTYFLLDMDSLSLGSLSGEPKWLDEGEGLLKWVSETLGYQAVYYHFGNLVAHAPNRNGVGFGVTEA